jgi:serine protease AprX
MNSSLLQWTNRLKAVRGPKQILTALALLVLAIPLNAAANPKTDRRAWQSRPNEKPAHARRADKAKAGLPNAFADDYKLDKELSELSKKNRDPRETVDLIVTFKVQGQQLPASFRRYNCGRRLDIINGYALCGVPVRLLDALTQFASVHRVHHNRPAHESDLLSSVAVEADILTKQYGYTGAGVTVAFIDSGLTEAHPDLNNRRVLRFVDFVNDNSDRSERNDRSDPNGHGTHVTGIVAGTGASDSRFAGIASGTNVVSLRVLDETGKGSIGDIIAAMDWVAKNHTAYNIRIVNMSVGAGVYESYWTDPLTLAAKALVDAGITVVAAAGNYGKNAAGELQWGGTTSPGVAPWVLTACAFSTMGTPDTGDDAVAAFSSSGPTAIDFTAKPDLCAPGVGIVSLAAPESELYRKGLLASPSWLLGQNPAYPFSPYISLTGTSQAAPFVTGTVALMLQANPKLTPNLIKAILQYTASFKAGVSPLRQGAGFMNSLGAVTLASFYAHPNPGSTLPIDPSWSGHIIWGNHMLSGGILDPGGNAWMPGVEWGWAKTQGDDGDNIVWGTSDDGDNIVWGTADDFDNIVWGTSDDGDNIVWGTSDDDDNIVWGTDCGGDDCDNIVWGTADDADNIVWGTADDGDNIVWGTSDDGDNIVWGTADDFDNIVWGTVVRENVVWPVNRSKAPMAKGGK